jgi:hypothetical protein
MLSDVSTFRETRLNHFRAMTQAPTARIAAFSAIDKEIIAAMEFTHSLLSCRNTLVPISALPPELLSRIFHFHACLEPPQQRLGWIVATHVCQHWRQVALNDPLLWAQITGFEPRARWTSEILVRAQNAPLIIDLFYPPSPEVLSKFPRTSPTLASSGSAICPSITLRACKRFVHWKLPFSKTSSSRLRLLLVLSRFANLLGQHSLMGKLRNYGCSLSTKSPSHGHLFLTVS